MVRPDRDQLSGVVQVDESYVGGVEAGVRGRETIKKAIVAIAAEVDGRKIGRIRLRWVPDLSAPVLRGFVKDSIAPASTVHTDGWPSYHGEFRGQLLSAQINTGDSEAQGLGNFVRVVEATAATNDLELPTVFRFSVMADLIGSATAMVSPNPDQSLRVLWDINDAIDTDIQTSIGLEYGFRDVAFLRAGKRFVNESQISHDTDFGAAFGGGLLLPLGEIGMLGVDYAYTSMGDLDNIQVFSFQLQF